jgi:CHASE3 domain sensor protein
MLTKQEKNDLARRFKALGQHTDEMARTVRDLPADEPFITALLKIKEPIGAWQAEFNQLLMDLGKYTED